MYNPQLEWYDKRDVISIFQITTRTYFRKLKKMSPQVRTKKIKNPKGRDTTLIYYKDLLDCFELQRKPKNLNNPENLRKYVGISRWDYLGNIVPGKSTVDEVKAKMKFIYDQIRFMDKKSRVFFSIEKNTNDDYFHSHFLLKTSLDKKTISSIILLVCEDEIRNEKRYYIRNYDFEKYHFRGSFYSDKFDVHDLKNQMPHIHSELLG
jgi:hypothetical protein